LKDYLLNCFALLLPIFLWNIVLYDSLPDKYGASFDEGIPEVILWSEAILRVAVFALPVFMKLSLKTRRQKFGFTLYLIGTLIYFSSWLMLILYPDSNWSSSTLGFTAPAYTPLFWLAGIGLVGKESFLKIRRLSLIYILLSLTFVLVHTSHAYLAFHQ
jgi:uncharacterized membrane protein YsdA (DUF1294 family)